VGDEHAGKLARCPHCQTIYTVPGGTQQAARPPSPFAETAPYPSAASAPFPSAAGTPKPGDRWTMKTPDGLTFGPVPRAELDRWLAEGRITPQSQLQQEGTTHWVLATQVYPQLQPVASNNPFGDRPAGAAGPAVNPYAPPAGGAYNWPTTSYRFREQHRGGTILAMGLVSIPCCLLVAIATVVMAIIDLQKMANGTMDPSGRGLTIAGLVCAVLRLVVDAIVIVVSIANQ
jgi:hypothetical protein